MLLPVIKFFVLLILPLLIAGMAYLITAKYPYLEKTRPWIFTATLAVMLMLSNTLLNPIVDTLYSQIEFEKTMSKDPMMMVIKKYDPDTYQEYLEMIKIKAARAKKNSDIPRLKAEIISIAGTYMQKYFKYASDEALERHLRAQAMTYQELKANKITLCCQLLFPQYFGIPEGTVDEYLSLTTRVARNESFEELVKSAVNSPIQRLPLPTDAQVAELFVKRFQAHHPKEFAYMSNPSTVQIQERPFLIDAFLLYWEEIFALPQEAKSALLATMFRTTI